MPTYLVTVIEKCQSTYIVDAESEEEAKQKMFMDEFDDSLGSPESLFVEDIVKVELSD